jgi:hypothetical protein
MDPQHHRAKSWHLVTDTDRGHLLCEYKKHNSNGGLTSACQAESYSTLCVESGTRIEDTIADKSDAGRSS